MNKNIFKNISFYTIGALIPKAIGFFLLPIFTRYLSPDEYGIINYTESITLFLFAITILSLNTYLLRHVFDYEKEEDRKKLIGNIFLFIGIMNVVLLILELAIFPRIIYIFNIQVAFKPYFILALTNNFLHVFSVVPLIIYRYQGEAKKFVMINVSHSLIQLIFSLLFVIYFNMGVLGRYYGSLLTNIIFLFTYLKIMFKYSILTINLPQIKEGLIFSLPLVPGTFLSIIISVSDRIMLERFVSLTDLGIYSVAYTLGMLLQILAYSSYLTYEPIIFSKIGKDGFADSIYKIKTFFMSIIIVLAFLYALFSKELLTIMVSSKFMMGVKVIPIIILSTVFISGNYLFGTILIGFKKTNISFLSNTAGAIINILVNIFLIPITGIYGAALSTLASYFIMYCFIYYYLSQHMGINYLTINKDMLLILVGSGLVYVFHYYIELDITFFLIMFKIIVVFFFILLISKLNNIKLLTLLNFKNS